MKKVLVYGLKNMRAGVENYLLTMQREMKDEISFVYIVEGDECIHDSVIKELNGDILYLPDRHNIKKYILFQHIKNI